MRQIGNPNMQQIPMYQQQQGQGNQSISQKITDYLNDNYRLITQAYTAQCHENYDQALENLDKLVFRMVSMMENADKNHRMRQTIYENREILSDMQIKQYHELNQANINKNIDQNYYLDYYLSSLPVKKQIEKKQEKKKVFWTEQEKSKFKEALQKFGKKDLKKISEYIGTKKPIQVRSHMQKHFKRLEKEGRLQQQQTESDKKVQTSDNKKIDEEQDQEISEDEEDENEIENDHENNNNNNNNTNNNNQITQNLQKIQNHNKILTNNQTYIQINDQTQQNNQNNNKNLKQSLQPPLNNS